MWFSYDYEDGFELHNTEESAEKRAKTLLDQWIDLARADGAWTEAAEQVCWGRVSRIVGITPSDDGEGVEDARFVDAG